MPSFKADHTDNGKRVDLYLSKKMPGFSRSSLKGLFLAKQVTIAGEVIKPSYKLKTDDNLRVSTRLLNVKPKVIKLPLVYEDGDVLVINKPSGVLTHSKGAINLEATVASSLRSKVDPELSGNRAGIVHRVDRATSGLLLLAKNKSSHEFLQRQFANRKVKKQYLAVAEGVPSLSEASIDVPIARNPNKPQTFMASAAGKNAVTNYQLKQTITQGDTTYSLLALQPETGRTHQIRVHLKYINHPVVGDRIYGHEGDHMLLHASQLSVTTPSKKTMTFTAPLPDYFYSFGVKKT